MHGHLPRYRLGWIANPSSRAAIGAVLTSLMLFALFRQDVMAAVALWEHSSAYGYAFLVLPISLYLIYSRRNALARIGYLPSAWGIAVTGGCAVLWWIGLEASILELRQFALVGMIQGIVLGVLGGAAYRAILFPMLYLFLLVPTGSLLLGPMQTLTTHSATLMLRWAGIPVFAEGHVIEAPTGVYEVTQGCAGLNFLLASTALFLVYAVEVYRTPLKRIGCVIVALALSIFVNHVRVFGIIWLAEATNRHIDIVDDHLLYGWGVYCVFVVAAMYAGLTLGDRVPAKMGIETTDAATPPPQGWWPVGAMGLALLAIAAGARVSSALVAPAMPVGQVVLLNFPDALGGWQKVPPERDAPLSSDPRADGFSHVAYAKDGKRIDLTILYYWLERDGYKATDIADSLAAEGRWTALDRETGVVSIGPTPLDVISTRLIQGSQRRRIWSYYWVAGHHTASALTARLFGLSSLFGTDGRSAMIVLSSDGDDDARNTLANLPPLVPMLDRVLDQAALLPR